METGTLTSYSNLPQRPTIIFVLFETTTAAVRSGELFGGLESNQVSRATFLPGQSYLQLYWLIRPAIGHEDKMMKWQDNGTPRANQQEQRFCYYTLSTRSKNSSPFFLFPSILSFFHLLEAQRVEREHARLSLLESTKRQAPFRLQGPTRRL